MSIVSAETAALIRSFTALIFSAAGAVSIIRALITEYGKGDVDHTQAHRAMTTGLLSIIAGAVLAS